MNTYPDEYLNFWADRYVERGMHLYGITLAVFLAHLHEIEAALDGEHGPLPLLMSQRAVSARELSMELASDELPRRNGMPFEPLHHHAHPRNARADFNFTRSKPHDRA